LNYARKLASDKDIPLEEVMHLDQSQKKEMHKKAPKSGSPSTFDQTFGQTFDQKIKPYFKQQSSYKKAKVACAALYNLIAKDGTITKQTMQEATGIKTTTLKTYLKYLTEASLIKRVGPDNGGHWEVTSGNNKH
jgi:predicted HTH transcriptional regulator